MSSDNEIKISKNMQKWEDMIVEIFPRAIPDRCVWNNEIDILNILFSMCYKNLNSIFYPDGQVFNLFGVDFSKEDGCIELITEESLDVIKPVKLSFHFFDNAYSWSYFRLETCDLPSILDKDDKEYRENLTSLENGEYNRYTKKTSFLIFPKESPFKWMYNKHFNKLSEKELWSNIEELMEKD